MSQRSNPGEPNKASTPAPAPPAIIPAADPPTESFEFASTSCSGALTAPGTRAAFVTMYSFEKISVKRATGKRASECAQ